MASRYWTGGANNGTWNDNNNWSDTEGGASGSTFPDDTNDVFVQATNQAISGLATGKAFASLTVSFGGTLGTAATPLTFTCTGAVTIRTGTGTHYLAATAAGTIVTTNVRETGTGKVFLGGSGSYTTINVGSNCTVDLGSSAACTTFQQSGGASTIANHTTDLTTLTISGGSCDCIRPATTANVGGTLKTKGVDAAITTANVFPGGKLLHWSSSTIGTSVVYPGGTATAVGSPYVCTVTNRTSYEGSKNFIDSPNVTFTNAATVIGQQAD